MQQIALVVDDSMLIRHTVCRYFEDRGFAVESATNGMEALEKLRNFQPIVIVTDIQMPKLDGRQLIQALKSNPKTSEIPIVVLATRRSAMDSGGPSPEEHVVFKDIDVASQLDRMLKVVLPAFEEMASVSAQR